MMRAPKHCGIQGCTQLVRPGTRCPQHQHSWGRGNPRTNTAEHKAWRTAVLKRDRGQCQLRYDCCTYRATIADHIIATGLGGTHYDLTNGQAACRPCHDRKSSQEGHTAQGHQTRP